MPKTSFTSVTALFTLLLASGCPSKDWDKFQARSKAAEARTNLKAIHVEQRAFKAETGSFSESLTQIGFEPERGNRYAYFASTTGAVQLRRDAKLPSGQDFSIIAADEHVHPKLGVPTRWEGSDCPVTPATDTEGKAHGPGVWGTGENQQFIAYAIGNVDDDADLDCWSIASIERTSKTGEHIAAGEPWHEKADFTK